MLLDKDATIKFS